MADKKEYMSFTAKVTLSQVVENLPVDEHPNIFRIIVSRDPAALVDCEDDPNWTYVYFDLLKPSTLQELESYIASRNVNTQSEIKENNPDLEKEEKSAKSSSYTEKLRSNKGSKEEDAKSKSIKARLRRTSKKSDSDPGTSKQ